jgi:transcriptional regulator with GAF, ATPase, and Fis domain
MDLRIWAYPCGDSAGCEDMIARLSHNGISCSHPGGVAPRGPGIVFFDQVDQALFNTLDRLSHNHENKVLALNLSGACLDNARYWALLRAGAADIIDCAAGEERPAEIAQRIQRWLEVDDLIDSALVRENLLGGTPAWRNVLREIVEYARFSTNGLLIIGETGTGKELAARLTHTLDTRPTKGQLVVLDCTTIVPELAGSEFFGHERGAFTGAAGPRDGAFALANGGTLFLDEIGELPPLLQAQLLRVMQERAYKRVGGNNWCQTGFRLICATHRDLTSEVAQGRFRADLYYRIATHTCKLPPLRERLEDIVPLALHFLGELHPGEAAPQLSKPVRDYLLQREYPGNVRELRQLVHRMSARHVGAGPVSVGDIPEDERPAAESTSIDWRNVEFERAISRALYLGAGLKDVGQYASEIAIRLAVESEAGNLHRAAQKLGVTDRALQLRRAHGRNPSQH